MKHFRSVLDITTDSTEQFLNLSFEVEECVRKSNVTEGICVVFSQHTTSAVFLDNDSEMLKSDWSQQLGTMAKGETEYKFDYFSTGCAHIKQILLGASVTIPITDGKLELGPRQFIMYADFYGCREKHVVVKIIGE